VLQPSAEGWQWPDLLEKKVGAGRTWTAGTAGGGGRRLLAEGDGEKKGSCASAHRSEGR
jgi:hypothetical protein